MAVETIPTFANKGAYRYKITIEGEVFLFRFYYLARHGSWYLTIMDIEENVLRGGIRIVIGWPLLLRDLRDELFGGILLAIRLDNKGDLAPSLEDFDGSVEIVLVTGEDIPVAASTEEPLYIVAAP